jgi:DNA (cytosine-5)-methyltransferase 1
MSALRIGSLCSGYGGLDMAVEAVLGGSLAWVSDIDKGAGKVLGYRYPDVPNLGDFTKTDWATVEPVEVLTAGFPCQPVSNAGKQLGDNDERWLWDDVLSAIRALRPGLVLLENVRGLLTNGRLFGRVLGSLADIGYDADWHCLRAADIGAPHNRFRVFILAHAADADHPRPRNAGQERCWRAAAQHGLGAGESELTLLPTPTANDYKGSTSARREPGQHRHQLDAVTEGQDRWGDYAEAIQRWEAATRPAPEPTQPTGKGTPRLSPAFTEWMQGLPAGWITDVPTITRAEALKLAGNGVVPQQAEAALRLMLGRTATGVAA